MRVTSFAKVTGALESHSPPSKKPLRATWEVCQRLQDGICWQLCILLLVRTRDMDVLSHLCPVYWSTGPLTAAAYTPAGLALCLPVGLASSPWWGVGSLI